MKKSFKKVVAILLAVLMMVCSFPLTALAAGGTRANIKLQFGSVTNSATNIKNYTVDRSNKLANFSTYSGMNSDELTYSNGAISGYGIGDFFTISVLVENISQISATEIAVKYSDAIEPAYLKNSGSTGPAIYTDTTAAYTGFGKLEAITAQSGNAIYNTTSTVGETSYIDEVNRVMHANFAVQTGADAIDLTSEKSVGKYVLTNRAIIATFMFKIVNSNAITFSIDTASDTYYLDTIANGGKVDQYKTYAPKVAEDASTAELDFMGKNEYVGSTTQTYTITFVDADGQQISSAQYEEGAAVNAPQLPAVTHDDAQHYTYAWDKEIPATATADGTYTIVKTGAAHTWDAGVTTKEPTATEAGEKTFTCTFDGCGATKKESLPATGETHTHTWGEWVYNGDAVYNDATKESTDGTQTRTCTTCGETETVTAPNTGKLYRIASQLTIDASILVKILVEKSVTDYYDEIYMSVTYPTKNGDMTEIINEHDIYYKNTYVRFAFDKINPHYLNEEAHYTIYGVKDGVTYYGDTYDFAITTYIQNQFTKYSVENYPNSYSNLRRLLADIIWYGYKAQIQQGYGIENGKKTPMTDYLTPEQLACRTQGDLTLSDNGNASLVTIDNPSAQTGAALRMGASVDLAITLAKKTTACPDLWSLQVEVTKQGQAPEVFSYATHPEMFLANGNYVNFYYNGVKGNEASVPVDVRLLDANGNVISNTRRTSIESYCYKQINNSKASQALKDVCDAIMRYAKSSATYIANKQG